MARPPSKFSPDGSSLDLGLSALLDNSKQAETSTAPLSPVVPAGLPESETVPTQAEPLSELEELAKAGDWKALGQRCDRLLPPQVSADERLELLETRFWWARSQQKLQAVPLSLLASPLEDISKKLLFALEGVPPLLPGQRLLRLKAEVALTLGEVAGALARQGEAETGERLTQLSSSFEGGISPKAAAPLLLVPESAPSNAGNSGNSGNFSSGVPEVPERRARRGVDSRDRLRSGFEPAPQHAGSQSNSTISSRAAPTSRRFVVFALVGLVIACLLLLRTPSEESASTLLAGSLWGGDAAPSSSVAPLRDGISPPELRAPQSKLVSGVNQLDSILEDIKNDRSQLADLKTRPTAAMDLAARTANPAPASHEPVTLSVSGAQGGGQKERIDMSGPREPASFPRSGQSPSYSQSLSSGNGAPRRDDRGGSGPAGRPDDVRRGPSAPSERPGFEDFKKPRTYRTLIETDVMSDPTIRGRVLDTLPARVEVLVEGREGYWLRVRSQKGNVGFILAQDASRQD